MTSSPAGLGIVNLKPRSGNLFASTDGTAARGIQASPFLEREAAFLTGGRLHNKAFRVYGLFNMFEMIEGVSLFNPEQFGNLPQVVGFFFQGFRDLLPQG